MKETELETTLKELEREAEQIGQCLQTTSAALSELERTFGGVDAKFDSRQCFHKEASKITLIERLQNDTRKVADYCIHFANRSTTHENELFSPDQLENSARAASERRLKILAFHERSSVLLQTLQRLRSSQSELVKILDFRFVEFEYQGLVTVEEIEIELKAWRHRARIVEHFQQFDQLVHILLRIEVLENKLKRLSGAT